MNLKTVVELLGSRERLAEAWGVHPSAVSRCGKVIPVEREGATRKALRKRQKRLERLFKEVL